jgi:hypothetical protein
MLAKARPVHIRPAETPQHRPRSIHSAETGEDAGDKTGSDGAVFLVAAGAQHFVHGAECEAAAGQHGVDRAEAERQHAMPRRLFQLPDTGAKRIEMGHTGHGSGEHHVASS